MYHFSQNQEDPKSCP